MLPAIDATLPCPTPAHRVKQKFTSEEDGVIVSMVESGGAKHWRLIAERLGGRTARQCRERWMNYLSPSVAKCAWGADEEALLRQKVTELGPQWSRIARSFAGRTDVALKNRYLRLMRRDRMAERKQRKAAAHPAPLPDPAPALISDDEGGAFWIDDGADYGHGWEFDVFDGVHAGLGALPPCATGPED
jgi:hypothetical protein